MSKILKNKIIKISALLTVLFLGTIFLYKLVYANKNSSLEYKTYTNENLSFSFEYPKNWIINDLSFDSIKIKQIELNSTTGFFIYFRSEKNNFVKCQPQIPCQIGQPHVFYPFNSRDFEQLVMIENKKIYLSKEGGETRNYQQLSNGEIKYTYTGEPLRINSFNYLLEEKNNSLAEELSIFGHDKEGNSLIIYYGFRDEDSTKNWPEYKEILKHIITSMKVK